MATCYCFRGRWCLPWLRVLVFVAAGVCHGCSLPLRVNRRAAATQQVSTAGGIAAPWFCAASAVCTVNPPGLSECSWGARIVPLSKLEVWCCAISYMVCKLGCRLLCYIAAIGADTLPSASCAVVWQPAIAQ
eukprot:13998188-Alexandrium_andersonii.AAC.1